MADTSKEPSTKRVRMTSRTTDPNKSFGCEATLSHMTPEDLDKLNSMVVGASWLRTTEDGRFESVDRFEPLPAPGEDPCLPPCWYRRTNTSGKVIIEYARIPDIPEEDGPALGARAQITIQHLCGYNNVPYEYEAGKLQSYGFECLRSRRDEAARFFEIWFLPGFWTAQGDLKEHIESAGDEPGRVKRAVDFLCYHVSFGTLHVGYQRACIVIE